MTSKLHFRFLLLVFIAITTFTGCEKSDEDEDNSIIKHVILHYTTDNNPEMLNVFLKDFTIGGITMDPSYPNSKSGDITIYENMPYTLNIEVRPMADISNISTIPYTGTIPGSMFNSESTNVIDVVIDNLVPVVYINDVKVPAATGNGNGNDGGGDGTGGTQALFDEVVSGAMYGKKIITFNVPSGTKTLTVKVTENNPNTDRNMADLFVRKGTEPDINHNPPQDFTYTWDADCASINSNRADEFCTFSTPGAGKWYAVLYGYNDSFTSRVTITVTD